EGPRIVRKYVASGQKRRDYGLVRTNFPALQPYRLDACCHGSSQLALIIRTERRPRLTKKRRFFMWIFFKWTFFEGAQFEPTSGRQTVDSATLNPNSA